MPSLKTNFSITKKLSNGLSGIAIAISICSISGCEALVHDAFVGYRSSKLQPTADTSLVNIVLEEAPDMISDRKKLLVCRKEDDQIKGEFTRAKEMILHDGIARGNLSVGTYRILRTSSDVGSGWGWEDGNEVQNVSEMKHYVLFDLLIFGVGDSLSAPIYSDNDLAIDFSENPRNVKSSRDENKRETEVGTCTSTTSAITRYERTGDDVKITYSIWIPHTTRLEFRVTDADLGKEIHIGTINLLKGTGTGERIQQLD